MYKRQLHGMLPLAALAIVFGRGGHLGAALLAVLIVRLLVLFLYDFRHPRRDVTRDHRATYTARLTACVPAFFIAHMFGYSSLGRFAVIAALIPAGSALVAGLGETLAPHLKTAYDAGDLATFTRLITQSGAAALLLGLCCLTAGLLVSSHTAQPMLLIALSAASAGPFLTALLECALAAGGRADECIPLEIAAVAASAFACILLTPRAGLPGAALSLAFASLVQITGQLLVVHSVLRHPRRAALLSLLKA